MMTDTATHVHSLSFLDQIEDTDYVLGIPVAH